MNRGKICPAFSADGRELAMCVVDGEATEIWTLDVDGSDARQLTDLGGWAIFPDWNRQGNRIVFSWASEPDTDTGLYVVHARSGRIRPLLVEEGYSLGHPVLSPDGRTVLYTRTRNALDDEGFPYPVEAQLWTVDVRSGATTQLTFDELDQGPDVGLEPGRLADRVRQRGRPVARWMPMAGIARTSRRRRMASSGGRRSALTAGAWRSPGRWETARRRSRSSTSTAATGASWPRTPISASSCRRGSR